MLKIKPYLKEMQVILKELDAAKENYEKVINELNDLDFKYQTKKFGYKKYIKIQNKILSNRTRSQILNAYKNYNISLKNQLIKLNNKILRIIYNDKSYNKLSINKISRKGPLLPSLEDLEIARFEVPVKKVIKRKKKLVKKLKPEDIKTPGPEQLEYLKVPKPVKLGFLKRLVYAFQAKEKPWLDMHQKVFLGGFLSTDFLKYILFGKEKQKDIFGSTTVLPSILSVENKSRIERELSVSKTDILDPYLLEKQIKELKSLISRKKPEIYKASTLGYLANSTVRKISIYFIEKYPEFFKKLYRIIRYANIRILANTYINIIFFLTMFSGILSFPLFTIFFALQGNPIGIILVRTIIAVVIVTNLTFWLGYYYPFMKMKSRRRSINTNLPFAIDHMSSVIASGVNPSTMFKLISTSREYGEISIEIEKITNYVGFFGYDILTAIKAVSLTTPSENFKEFLDGFVSTIETGGDLKSYLSQKSSEALLNYRLERQKYVESLSTYSDLYTGVLIAAPLFFVTALSLVSVLGGSIGGMSVNSIITLGTYLIIPALNLVFLIFLELNQPEI